MTNYCVFNSDGILYNDSIYGSSRTNVLQIVPNNKKKSNMSLAYSFINVLLPLFNCIMLIIVYLYVSETSNTLNIINNPNVSITLDKIEKLINITCKELGNVC